MDTMNGADDRLVRGPPSIMSDLEAISFLAAQTNLSQSRKSNKSKCSEDVLPPLYIFIHAGRLAHPHKLAKHTKGGSNAT